MFWPLPDVGRGMARKALLTYAWTGAVTAVFQDPDGVDGLV